MLKYKIPQIVTLTRQLRVQLPLPKNKNQIVILR